jgi:hypothetical protein
MRRPMTIRSPCIITARLLPGVKTTDALISIEYNGWSSDARRKYTVYVDTSGFEEKVSDLSSGVGGGTLQEGLRSFLSFAAACGESINHQRRTGQPGENCDLFDPPLDEWCADNEEELSMLGVELEETPNLIEE